MSQRNLIYKCFFTCVTETIYQILQDQYEAETLKDLIGKKQAIKKFRVYPLNEEEVWKIDIIEDLSLCKRGCLEIDMEKDDIDAMLEAVTTD